MKIANILDETKIKNIAVTYGRTSTPSELGEKYGVSKQRIQQIAKHLRDLGVKIPQMKSHRYKDIVFDLRKSNPELFVEETK